MSQYLCISVLISLYLLSIYLPVISQPISFYVIVHTNPNLPTSQILSESRPFVTSGLVQMGKKKKKKNSCTLTHTHTHTNLLAIIEPRREEYFTLRGCRIRIGSDLSFHIVLFPSSSFAFFFSSPYTFSMIVCPSRILQQYPSRFWVHEEKHITFLRAGRERERGAASLRERMPKQYEHLKGHTGESLPLEGRLTETSMRLASWDASWPLSLLLYLCQAILLSLT